MPKKLIPQEESGPMKPTGIMPGQDAAPPDPEEIEGPEQDFYDQFVIKAINFIHGQKSSPAVLQHMNQPDLPVEQAVGRTAAMIVTQITESAKAAKQEIYPDAITNATAEVVDELVEFGQAAKIFDKVPPEVVEDAYLYAVHEVTEGALGSPEGKEGQRDAQDAYAAGISGESEQGALDPEFMEGSIGLEEVMASAGGQNG